MLTLKELQKEFEALEALASSSITDKGLLAKVQELHGGYVFLAPRLPPGTRIYRTTSVKTRPLTKSRISYPPIDRVINNGRLNRAGEVMFYGALNEFAGCLLECNAQVGDFYALSAWQATTEIRVNQLGYSKEALDESGTDREVPDFAQFDQETERNRLIRKWQTHAFTRHVCPGEEHLYRTTIALKEMSLGLGVPANFDLTNSFSGIQYPSVAAKLASDNVVLFPCEVDRKLELLEVALVVIDPSDSGGSLKIPLLPFNVRFYDYAISDFGDNLLWGQTSRITYQS